MSPAGVLARRATAAARAARAAAARAAAARAAAEDDPDAGTAIIEFIFVAIVVMVPLMYLLVAVATLQRSQLAVAQAARDAGRAFATSDTAVQASDRVEAAVRLALTDQRLRNDATVRFVIAGHSCDAGDAITPQLTPGTEFGVCVTRRADLPGVPSVLSGRGVVTTAEYIVHVDDFRTVGS